MSSKAIRYRAVCDYHARTKHHFHRMARSSGYMDWANQPDPFRRYAGAPTVILPLASRDPDMDFNGLYRTDAPAAAAFTHETLAHFLELALGLSAWKILGRDRWALRINPSSGNLHPTEAYLLLTEIEGLADGLFHYTPETHGLAKRIALPAAAGQILAAHFAGPGFLVALSSVIWREAWKYGERAFRYCQHDIGHALAALCYSARIQGWQTTVLTGTGETQLARLLGFDRTAWRPQEAEIPVVLVRVAAVTEPRPNRALPPDLVAAVAAVPIEGRPAPLSPACRPWEILQAVTQATRTEREAAAHVERPAPATAMEPSRGLPAAAVIRGRRSAVAFDFNGRMERDAFLGLVGRTQPCAGQPPFDPGLGPPRISLLLFVHQVIGMAPGLYMFVRHPSHRAPLAAACDPDFQWAPAKGHPALYLLRPGDYRVTAADLACRQEIAGAGVFSLAMLAQFQPVIAEAPWRYRQLFWEAGMIGQVLYLESEARGYRGTGIGCYFDDPVHDLLGITDLHWQDLYHFTVGVPREDKRLQTLPPYTHRTADRKA